MAQRTTYPIETPRTAVQTLFASLTGNTTSDLQLPTQEAINGEVTSATRSGVGAHSLVFRHSYPELKCAPNFTFVGTTAGLNGRCTAIDVVAKTAAVVFCVGNTPTDLATTDTVFIEWTVRNSGKNR